MRLCVNCHASAQHIGAGATAEEPGPAQGSGAGGSAGGQAGKDGMEGLEEGPARLRFAHDSRLAEVQPCQPLSFHTQRFALIRHPIGAHQKPLTPLPLFPQYLFPLFFGALPTPIPCAPFRSPQLQGALSQGA